MILEFEKFEIESGFCKFTIMNTKIYIFLLIAVFTIITISDVTADPSANPSSVALSRSKV